MKVYVYVVFDRNGEIYGVFQRRDDAEDKRAELALDNTRSANQYFNERFLVQ